MKLKTLEDMNSVHAYEVFKAVDSDKGTENFLLQNTKFISVDHHKGVLAFKIQDGPVKDGVPNGCQVQEIIAVARHMLHGLDKTVSCPENKKAFEHLSGALNELYKRTKDRENRGVEATNNP